MARREEEAAELEAGPRLRRTSRRAIVWGLSWAKTAARVSSEAAAAASIPADADVVEALLERCRDGGEPKRVRSRSLLGRRWRGTGEGSRLVRETETSSGVFLEAEPEKTRNP